jgi:hypothetical protein
MHIGDKIFIKTICPLSPVDTGLSPVVQDEKTALLRRLPLDILCGYGESNPNLLIGNQMFYH